MKYIWTNKPEKTWNSCTKTRYPSKENFRKLKKKQNSKTNPKLYPCNPIRQLISPHKTILTRLKTIAFVAENKCINTQ